jgi:Spy/CpxP family protein refolding chaperone
MRCFTNNRKTNHIMKPRIIIPAVLCVAGIFFTHQLGAQGPGPGCGPFGHHGDPVEMLTKALELTDAQKAQLQPIVDKARPEVLAIMKEAHAKIKPIIDNAAAQLRPLLTPEQQKKLDGLEALRAAHQPDFDKESAQ